MTTKLSAFIATAVLSLAAASANAGTITFTGLSSSSNFSEAGMNMTSNSVWNWPGMDMAHMDGGQAVFKLASAGDFFLTSVELLAAGGGGTARFDAYNNNVLVGTVDHSGAGVFGFAFGQIDEFRVSVPGNHFTFDNVNFRESAVPEPSGVALLGLGLAGLLFSRRRAIKAK